MNLSAIAPTFPVNDVSAALAHYTQVFGFNEGFVNLPVFAMVERNGLRIGLQQASVERPAGTGSCYLWAQDVGAIFEELRANGAEIKDALKYQGEYELRDFVVHDLDGNHIGVGGA